MNTQDLVTLGMLLRDKNWAAAYRIVSGAKVTPLAVENINSVSQQYGVTYTPSGQAVNHWVASYKWHNT